MVHPPGFTQLEVCVRVSNVFSSVLLATTFVALPALAETLTHQVAKVSIDVPASCNEKYKGNEITLSANRGDFGAAFAVVPAGAIDDAAGAAGRQLARRVKQVKIQDDEKININGMRGEVLGGDGRLDGVDIDWMIAIIDTPSKDNDLMIVVMAEDAKIARHKGEVKWLFNHIKPAP